MRQQGEVGRVNWSQEPSARKKKPAGFQALYANVRICFQMDSWTATWDHEVTSTTMDDACLRDGGGESQKVWEKIGLIDGDLWEALGSEGPAGASCSQGTALRHCVTLLSSAQEISKW